MQNEQGFKNRLGIVNDERVDNDVDLKSLYSELSEFEQRIEHLENIGRRRASTYGVIGITLGLVIGVASVYISYYLWMDIIDISNRAESRKDNIHIDSFLGWDIASSSDDFLFENNNTNNKATTSASSSTDFLSDIFNK